MNTITLTDEQMKALQSGQSITIEPPKACITKWKPKGHAYSLWKVLEKLYPTHIELGFCSFTTVNKQQAAAKAISSYARQLSWLEENNDGFVADFENCDQLKFYVAETRKNTYVETHFTSYLETGGKTLGTVYMSKENAEKLCQLLNDGIVEF